MAAAKLKRVPLIGLQKWESGLRPEPLDEGGRQTASSLNLAIVYRSIETLVHDPRNPRRHTPRQICQIAQSIELFGLIVPILIDDELNVIAGHGRLAACKQLKITDIPTIQLQHLTEAQIRAFKIADNRLTEIAEWDDQLLGEELKELSILDLNFSLEITGFEMGEIDLRIQKMSNEVDDTDDPAPPIVSGFPVSKAGDLWVLNEHRIVCADALEPATYEELLDDERAQMVFSDPPYNVTIQGNVGGRGTIRHREFTMASGEMSQEEFTAFLTKAFKCVVKYSAPNALSYVCMDWRHLREILEAGYEEFSSLLNLCVWAKDNAGLGSFYRSQHELIFVFRNGNKTYRNNISLGKHGRNRSNVWSYAGANSFARKSDEGNVLKWHPTPKPTRMVADAILDCTKRNDIVLDPFLGSGSTLMAAEYTGRRCFGIEIDPLYIDTAVRRWQKHTGADAVLARSGETFNDLLAEANHE